METIPFFIFASFSCFRGGLKKAARALVFPSREWEIISITGRWKCQGRQRARL